MKLREPRTELASANSPEKAGSTARFGWILVLQAVAIMALAVLLLVGGRRPAASPEVGLRARELAAKLRAAGADSEAARVLEEHLGRTSPDGQERANLSWAIAQIWLQEGQFERAVRWLYEAEAADQGELADELSVRLVSTLERLGRPHAARAEMKRQTSLGPSGEAAAEDDPVLARVADREIRRSELERVLDSLRGGAGIDLNDPEQLELFLRKYVADELLWQKAVRLEYDRDAKVERAVEVARKQLVVASFVENEVMQSLDASEEDLRNYWSVHRERYDETAPDADFEQLRSRVERDYLQDKAEAAYRELIESELSAAGVELFPERAREGGR